MTLMKLKPLLAFPAFLLLVCSTTDGQAQSYKLAPSTGGNVFASASTEFAEAPVNIINWGAADVNSFSYTLYYMDTQTSDSEQTVQLSEPLAFGETRRVMIPIKSGSTLATTDVIFNITQVDGHANEASVGYTYITRCTVRKIPTKRVLLEDYSALWCQWCPRGIVALESLLREHPDNAVGVQIHKGDKLASATAYTEGGMILKYANTVPSVYLQRRTKIADIYTASAYENEMANLTLMDINVQAEWDETDNSINVTAEVEPCASPNDGSTYAIGYVLTASGLKNSAWLQQSNWSSFSSSDYDDAPEEMAFFRDPSNYVDNYYYVKGVTFNHIAIASQGVDKGVAGSLDTTLEPNKIYTHNTTFDNISQYQLIQDRSKLAVVAILLNAQTGAVENVATCSISANGETGIQTATTAKQPDAVYNLHGQRMESATSPGVYIVNGKKIFKNK